MRMGLAVTEITALASTTLAATAATASWANVILTRRSIEDSVLPSLHVTGMELRPSPISALSELTPLHFDVHNAGGGIAKGPVFLLTCGKQYVIGIVAPMLLPGQTYRITTDMQLQGDDREWGGMVGCLDLHNHRRVWRLHNPKPRVFKTEDQDSTVIDLYKQVFPEVDIASYKLCSAWSRPYEDNAS